MFKERPSTIEINKVTPPPLVSILIPTRNSERTIEICLESISRQTYPRIEIIIVDQQSQDRTLNKCKRFDVKITMTPPTKNYTPPTKSRNIGSKIAKGKYLLHLDSDMELPDNLIEECVNRFKNYGFGAIIIHEIDLAEGFWGKCKSLERKCIVDDPYLEGARFVKSEVYNEVGGYDENLSFGEDWDIHQRYKKVAEIGVAGEVIKHHVGYVSLGQQIIKKYHYAKTAGSYIRKYPYESMKQLFLRSAYLRNRKLLISDPIHAVGFVFLKLCEYCAATLGLLMGNVE